MARVGSIAYRPTLLASKLLQLGWDVGACLQAIFRMMKLARKRQDMAEERLEFMTFDPARGHAALRRGIISTPEAEYFLTLCTNGRRTGLDGKPLAECVIGEMRAMEADSTWVIRCATIMPDHLHLFIILGQRLSLGKVVQRLKAKTAAALRNAGLAWEHAFFDHQLRVHDECRPLFLYIYLNPYRKELCMPDQQWPWFVCHEDDWVWLRDHMDRDYPPPEWLR